MEQVGPSAWEKAGDGGVATAVRTDMGRGKEEVNKRRPGSAAQAARGSGENGGGTSITTTGTGEREEQRRASCTSDAVPDPPGKAITSTEVLNAGDVWAWATARAWTRRRRLRMGPAQRP